jgi:hypothetical protein
MNINSRGFFTLTAVASMLVMAGCKKKDAVPADTSAALPAPAPAPAAPAALHVTDVSTGKGLTADTNLSTPTDTFGVRDTIYVLVKTDGASTASKLDAKWTYNGKQTVNESSQNIAPTGGEARNEFHIQKASAWPKGNYKVEIMLDGAPAGSKDFTVK